MNMESGNKRNPTPQDLQDLEIKAKKILGQIIYARVGMKLFQKSTRRLAK